MADSPAGRRRRRQKYLAPFGEDRAYSARIHSGSESSEAPRTRVVLPTTNWTPQASGGRKRVLPGMDD